MEIVLSWTWQGFVDEYCRHSHFLVTVRPSEERTGITEVPSQYYRKGHKTVELYVAMFSFPIRCIPIPAEDPVSA
jgi:hypothetical protein